MDAREEYAASIDATLIHRGAFTEQLNLVGADASVEQLALTDDDVQFLGITVDESESENTASFEGFSDTTPRRDGIISGIIVNCTQLSALHKLERSPPR